MDAENLQYTETVLSVTRQPGTPSCVTVRAYCDMGLVPHIRDANGRRLLRSDAPQIVAEIYAERIKRRGRPNSKG